LRASRPRGIRTGTRTSTIEPTPTKTPPPFHADERGAALGLEQVTPFSKHHPASGRPVGASARVPGTAPGGHQGHSAVPDRIVGGPRTNPARTARHRQQPSTCCDLVAADAEARHMCDPGGVFVGHPANTVELGEHRRGTNGHVVRRRRRQLSLPNGAATTVGARAEHIGTPSCSRHLELSRPSDCTYRCGELGLEQPVRRRLAVVGVSGRCGSTWRGVAGLGPASRPRPLVHCAVARPFGTYWSRRPAPRRSLDGAARHRRAGTPTVENSHRASPPSGSVPGEHLA
jgi:hypothetical protein